MPYLYKQQNYCDAECAIEALTGHSTRSVGYVWDADEVLEIIGAALKIDIDNVHSDNFPQEINEDVSGKCANCNKTIY